MGNPILDPRGEAGHALALAVADYGSPVLADAKALSNLFKDLLAEWPLEASLLVAAAEANVAAMLQQQVAGVDPDTAVRLTAAILAERRALDPMACTWAVAQFARALGYPLSQKSQAAQAMPGPSLPTKAISNSPSTGGSPVPPSPGQPAASTEIVPPGGPAGPRPPLDGQGMSGGEAAGGHRQRWITAGLAAALVLALITVLFLALRPHPTSTCPPGSSPPCPSAAATPSSSATATLSPSPGPSPSPTPSLSPSGVPVASAAQFLYKIPVATGDAPTVLGTASINGKDFPSSLAYSIGFVEPIKTTTFNLDAAYSSFVATLGLDRVGACGGEARFEVIASGIEVYNHVIPAHSAVPISVSIKGADQIKIISDWGNAICGASAVWGNAQVVP